MRLIFQREDINESSAVTKLQSAEGSSRLLCDNNGPAVEELEEQIIDGQLHDVQLLNLIPQATLAVDRNRIAQSLLDCMSSRFETLLSEPVYLVAMHLTTRTGLY